MPENISAQEDSISQARTFLPESEAAPENAPDTPAGTENVAPPITRPSAEDPSIVTGPSPPVPAAGVQPLQNTTGRNVNQVTDNTEAVTHASQSSVDTLISQRGESFQHIVLPKDSNAIDALINHRMFPSDLINYFPQNKNVSTKKSYLEEKEPGGQYGKEGHLIHHGIQSEIWFTPLIFLLFISYVSIFSWKKKMLKEDFKEIFSFSLHYNKLWNEPLNAFQSRFLLVIAGIINISLFIFFATSTLQNHDVENFTWVLFLILALTALFVLFKIASVKLICYIFFDKNISFKWPKIFYSLIAFYGIALIPVVLCLSYGPVSWIETVVYAGFFFCIGLIILYLSKIILFFFGRASSLLYLILYLCSLEILPAIAFLGGLTSIIN